MKVEVISRDTKTVLLKIDNDQVPMDVESFDSSFQEISSGIFESKIEFDNMINDKLKDIESIIPTIIRANTKNPAAYMALAQQVSDYCEKWNVETGMAMAEIRVIYQKFLDNAVNNGISFNEEMHSLPEHLKKKNRSNAASFKKEQPSRIIKAGPSLGELHPSLADLKNKLKTTH